MVKVQLEGGRVRTYFNTDITRFSANLFGPEQVKIKSLVCRQPVHNHSIHLVCIYIETCECVELVCDSARTHFGLH